jgi:hypothetical protein
MSHFGISQNFRNATLLSRFARTEHETKNDKKIEAVVVADSASSSSTSKKTKKKASQSQPSANKLSAVTARYVTKSADHM